MLKKIATVGFWCGVFTGLLAGGTAWGKPADLPDNNQIECVVGADDPPGQRKYPIEQDVTPKVETAAPAIDGMLPVFVEQWLEHVGDLLARPERVINLEALLAKLPPVGASENAAEAQPVEPQPRAGQTDKDANERALPLFVIAEFYRRVGNYDSARFYYQRVHLLSPTSRLGRMAIDRLQQVEERLRDDAEEAGKPQSMNRQMHKGLMPLGLVCLRY